MIQAAPAFWVRFRGKLDETTPMTTNYSYAATFLAPNNVVLLSATRVVQGPPQLTKDGYMEVNWTIPPGLVRVLMTRGGNPIFQSNGSSSGFRDEGQYLVNNGGVLNQ